MAQCGAEITFILFGTQYKQEREAVASIKLLETSPGKTNLISPQTVSVLQKFITIGVSGEETVHGFWVLRMKCIVYFRL